MAKLTIGNGIGDMHLVGSKYFFEHYDDYYSKDVDYVCFVDEPIMFKDVMNLNGKNNGSDNEKKDIFY